MAFIPSVLENEGRVERHWDVYSRLLKDRIIFVEGEVNTIMANTIIAQLLYLDNLSNDDITMYINSPGGSVSDGLGIIDTMNAIKSNIVTVAVGLAASMGAMILCQGTKGKRFVTPHAEVMIHQPLGGFKGQATDIEIHAKVMAKVKQILTEMMAESCGKDFETVRNDMERDNFMFGEEAVIYGIADKVIPLNQNS